MVAALNQTVETQDNTQLDNEIINSAVTKINETISKRKKNDRDNVIQALRAGHYLNQIKETVQHGDWTNFVVEHLEYDNPRLAQIDMQIWRVWSQHLDDVINLDAIMSDDADAVEIPEQFIGTSITAMRTFVSSNVPDSAFRLAIDSIKSGTLSVKLSKRIVETAKKIEEVPKDKRDFVRDIVTDHEIHNPAIVDFISEAHDKPDLKEQLETGYIFVPGVEHGQGKQISISDMGKTDADMVLRYEEVEEELRDLNDRLDKKRKRELEFATYKYLTDVEGTPEEIIKQLTKLMYDNQTIFKVQLKERVVTKK